MDSDYYSRRTFLGTSVGIVGSVLAGCLETDDEDIADEFKFDEMESLEFTELTDESWDTTESHEEKSAGDGHIELDATWEEDMLRVYVNGVAPESNYHLIVENAQFSVAEPDGELVGSIVLDAVIEPTGGDIGLTALTDVSTIAEFSDIPQDEVSIIEATLLDGWHDEYTISTEV